MSLADRMAEPPFALRGHRPFNLYWVLRGLSSMSYQVMTVAVGWQVYDLTHSPLDLGLVGLAQFVPAMLLALPAGHAIDRYRRRTIVRSCVLANMAVALLLCLASATGHIKVGFIYPLACLLGATQAFDRPAMSALLAGLVPRSSYGRAIAWSSSVGQTATIVGPAIGGLLYGLGPIFTYGACALIYLTGFGMALLLPAGTHTPGREPATLRSVFAGLAFIARDKTILGSISLDLFAVMLGGATALLPVYARDILEVGPVGLGLLRGAPAVGALLVSSLLARFPLQRHNGPAMFASVVIFGLATCVFAVSTDYMLSLGALAFLGAADMISVYVRLTLVQLRTPDEMRGRVSSVNFIFIGTSNQFGEFESGVTAAWLGTVPAVLLGGIGTLAVVGIWWFLFPGLRKVDRLEAETPI
jgi:MFS family permease